MADYGDTGYEHDARYEEYDTLDNWKLEHGEQDIRGRPLVGPNGHRIGVIQDLLVDKAKEHVGAIRLEDGTTTGVHHLEIKKDKVIWHRLGTGTREGTVAGHHGDRTHTEEVVPIVEEEVAIGKRAVEGGTIRVRSHVETETVGEDVRLRDEHVEVERRPVDKTLRGDAADAAFKDRKVSVTEHDEEAVVSKEARVTEEVVVKKDADEHVEHVEETVRKTDVEVDRDRKPRR